MDNLSKFKNVIQELTLFFQELGELEQAKLKIVAENNLKELEVCMNKEQVAIMQLRVLEKKREGIQKELGFSNKSFQEIIALLEGEAKEEITILYNKLADALTLFNQTAASAKMAIEANLYSINAILERLQEKNGVNQGAVSNGFASKRV